MFLLLRKEGSEVKRSDCGVLGWVKQAQMKGNMAHQSIIYSENRNFDRSNIFLKTNEILMSRGEQGEVYLLYIL